MLEDVLKAVIGWLMIVIGAAAIMWLLRIPTSDHAASVISRIFFCALAVTTAAIVWRGKQEVEHKKAIYFVLAMTAVFSVTMWGHAHLSGHRFVDAVLMKEPIPLYLRPIQLGLAAAVGCVLGSLLRRLRHPTGSL